MMLKAEYFVRVMITSQLIVLNSNERKKMIRDKRLCFNCTGRQHRASDCRSRRLCLNCNGKHHTSICDRIKTPSLMSNSDQNIIYPTVTIKVNGISVGLH